MTRIGIGPFAVHLERSSTHDHDARWIRSATGLAAATGLVFAMAAPASADSSTGEVAVTLATRSVSVSLSNFEYTGCLDGSSNPVSALVVPGGSCISPEITVTNGSLPSLIVRRASSMTPKPPDTTTHPWLLDGNVGIDQYQLTDRVASGFDQVSASDSQDHAFDAGTANIAEPAETALEQFKVHAPSASTESFAVWQNSITWTANPVT